MSVYSYIEAFEPDQKKHKDKSLHIGFNHGIGWFYQIGVAGGKRTYESATPNDDGEFETHGDYQAISIYEVPLTTAISNYDRVIEVLYSVESLRDYPNKKGQTFHSNDKLWEDLAHLLMAKNWYERALKKLPTGLAKLDWCEFVYGQSQDIIKKWDEPNDHFNYFLDLGNDCQKLINGKISLKNFNARYKHYDFHGEEFAGDMIELLEGTEIANLFTEN